MYSSGIPLTEELNPNHHPSPPEIPQTPIALEIAGRNDAHHTFADFRSPAYARNRILTEYEKYYNYRGVHRGALHRLHHQEPSDYISDRRLPADWDVVCMTKQRLYYEAQRYPKPPRRHRREGAKDYWPTYCWEGERRKERKWGRVLGEREWREAVEVVAFREGRGEGFAGDETSEAEEAVAEEWEEAVDSCMAVSEGLVERVLGGKDVRGGG